LPEIPALLWLGFCYFGKKCYNKIMSNNIFWVSLRFVFVDVVGDIIYFPIWWYTKGLLQSFTWAVGVVTYSEKVLGLGVWVKNWFRPMYRQTDLTGRLISFFMRTVNILAKSVAMIFVIAFAVLVFLWWLILPLFIFYEIYINLLMY